MTDSWPPPWFGSIVKDENAPEMELCPCGRMNKSPYLWLCRCCYLEKEIGYVLSELHRGGNWPAAGIRRLERLVGSE